MAASPTPMSATGCSSGDEQRYLPRDRDAFTLLTEHQFRRALLRGGLAVASD
ncbi:hypothetical protein [Mycobacterium sp. MS1601]|uniref:hypothetical protein n=1 Tax=Mycobacterium sp. MS1601 TaxID=1936029 RepID=UPI0012F7E6CE|nr:hypothetical protein [Mycobacterium sp. MS1601]